MRKKEDKTGLEWEIWGKKRRNLGFKNGENLEKNEIKNFGGKILQKLRKKSGKNWIKKRILGGKREIWVLKKEKNERKWNKKLGGKKSPKMEKKGGKILD